MYFIEMTLAVYHGNELLFIVIVIVIVIKHTMELSVICEAMTLMWRHC